jgi:hypothetical protein
MSRIDKIKQQNPELNVNLIDVIAKLDPSNTNKYVDFLVKMFKQQLVDVVTGEVNNLTLVAEKLIGKENHVLLKKFEEHSKANRIKNPDISSYKDWKMISSAIIEADEVVRLKELEKQTKKLFENDDWLVLIPLSLEASQNYGKGTKWCITQETHWKRYMSNYKIIFILNRKNNEKFAVSKERGASGNIQGWESNDEEINPLLIPIPIEILGILQNEFKTNETISSLIPHDMLKPSDTIVVTKDNVHRLIDNNIFDTTDYETYRQLVEFMNLQGEGELQNGDETNEEEYDFGFDDLDEDEVDNTNRVNNPYGIGIRWVKDERRGHRPGRYGRYGYDI